jgi:nucleotidyltransferase substrate binding protein (TIGR01987 family)
MDQELTLKLKEYHKALSRLRESLIIKRPSALTRDSAIKRFEFCFEICWKTIKLFLRQKYGHDAFSPKEAFRGLVKNQMITAKEVETLLQMTDNRNEIIHTYNEDFAKEIFKKIPKYYSLMDKIHQQIK